MGRRTTWASLGRYLFHSQAEKSGLFIGQCIQVTIGAQPYIRQTRLVHDGHIIQHPSSFVELGRTQESNKIVGIEQAAVHLPLVAVYGVIVVNGPDDDRS